MFVGPETPDAHQGSNGFLCVIKIHKETGAAYKCIPSEDRMLLDMKTHGTAPASQPSQQGVRMFHQLDQKSAHQEMVPLLTRPESVTTFLTEIK